jgi:F-type H+-transporting ATPase subunit epsilon
MSQSTFHLTIITPEKVVFDETIEKVTLPTTTGDITVLPHHIHLLSTLKIGMITTFSESGETFLAISGGFVDICNNTVTVLAETAETADEINEERAHAAKERAIKHLSEVEITEADHARLRASIQKSFTRIAVLDRYKKRKKTA